MIYVKPGNTFQSNMDNAPTGLVGTVGVRILRASDGAIVSARKTTGIIELVAGSGTYRAQLVAPQEAGEYTIFWDTGVVGPGTTATEDMTVSAIADDAHQETGSNIEPSVAEVAALLESRTRDGRSGALLGTFTEKTTPTEAQVLKLIYDAINDVRTDIGVEDIPDGAAKQVKSLVALSTAMKIEESYFTEQIETQKSPYKLFEKQYERRLQRTVLAVQRALEGDVEDTEIETLPHYDFPDGTDPQGMIGWGTLFGG
jgi:hypothetical protein